jgi:hypothetical protein
MLKAWIILNNAMNQLLWKHVFIFVVMPGRCWRQSRASLDSLILKSPHIKMCSENTVPVWIHYKFDIPPKCSNCIPYFAIEKNFIRLYFRLSLLTAKSCFLGQFTVIIQSNVHWGSCLKQSNQMIVEHLLNMP